MNKFLFTKASDVQEAVITAASDTTSKFVAGGTNLLDLMKLHIERPGRLIDINQTGLNLITENEQGGVRLGALATNAQTAYHPLVESRYPLLAKAILSGASAQLRNMATNGGNLLQRTRCYYFYDTQTACNKREPGTGCSAVTGYNRIHAILGTSSNCIATHPSDMAVALAALDARINVEGTNGPREIPVLEFHRLPGNTPHIESNLQRGEMITSIDLPPETFTNHYAYLKLRDRRSYAFALVSVAVCLSMENDRISACRLALGGVAHKPWRLPAAEAAIAGMPASKEAFERIASAYLEGAIAYEHNGFKIELAKRAIIRAFSLAINKQQP